MPNFDHNELLLCLDSIPSTLLVVDKNMKIVYINQTTCDFLNVRCEEILGRNMDSLLERKILANSPTVSAFSTKKTAMEYVRGKHMKNPILTTSTPILDENDQVQYVVAFSINDLLAEDISKLLVEEKHKADSIAVFLSQMGDTNVNVVAKSRVMIDLLSLCRKIANADSVVLVQGETGTGKEVISRYIHNMSNRRDKVFVPVNCAAIPNDLLESEFFGYESGAFTGAKKEGKLGIFELADGGTLLLDEIGELSLALQSKLLRILETGELSRLGSEKVRKVNVRVICATNKDLFAMTKEGLFREDLYYRINVIPLETPPLRERKDDVIPLANSILAKLNSKYKDTKILSEKTKNRFLEYDWPGNVRELKNVIERLYLLSESDFVDFTNYYTFDRSNIGSFKNSAFSSTPPTAEEDPDVDKSLKELLQDYEERIIRETLDRHDGKVAKAAEVLKVHKSAIYRKLDRSKNE